MTSATRSVSRDDSGIHHARGFDEWKAMLGHRFVPVRLVSDQGETFSGTLRERALRHVSVAEITADSHRVVRAPSQISPRDPAVLKLSVQLTGTGLVVQDGRQATLHPGDAAIYDTARPYTLAFDETIRCLVFAFPRSAIDLTDRQLSAVTALPVHGNDPAGRLVVPFLRELGATVLELSETQAMRFTHNALDLVTTLLVDVLDTDVEPHGAPTLADIKDWIDQHLADEDLSPGRIAATHFVSPRHVQNLFSNDGTTLSAWIRGRRLERCRRELAIPERAAEPVAAIGRRWGFTDAAHFSRTFKSRYGVPPARYRELAR